MSTLPAVLNGTPAFNERVDIVRPLIPTHVLK